METLTQGKITHKNIFEDYLQLIERMRLEQKKKEELGILTFLENIILLQERIVQEHSSNRKINKKLLDGIHSTINEFLNNWYQLLELGIVKNILPSFVYNFIPTIPLLEKVNKDNYDDFVRYITKLHPPIQCLTRETSMEMSGFLEAIASSKLPEKEKNKMIQSQQEKYLYKKRKAVRKKTGLYWAEHTHKSYSNPSHFFQYLEYSTGKRYAKNYFQIDDLKTYYFLSVEKLHKLFGNLNIEPQMEKLFDFDEKTENVIWEVNVNLESKYYDAGNISYFMMVFSQGIKSIGDIDVELNSWGDGSKWFQFILKIKSRIARLDLLEVMKQLRQNMEAVTYGKPLDEIKKLEAEAKKSNAEAEKIKKESANIDSSEMASAKSNLDYEERRAKIENIQANTLKTKVEALKGIAELINDGAFKNDGKMTILMNDCLFAHKLDHKALLGNVDMIEAKETVIKKDDEPKKGKEEKVK
ncbi:MAG: hypothetical protein HY063_01535 [Bacteroidetes bacterium]|nr:hypothetical protein [Bacteroidota bacterium]